MKLALVQERQNRLYAFHEERPWFQRDEIVILQRNMLEKNLSLLRRAGAEGCDVALLSEAINYPGNPTWHDGSQYDFVRESQDEVLLELSRMAKAFDMVVAAGVMLAGEGKIYNAAVIFDRSGKQVLRYKKQFLAGSESDYVTPGRGFPVWDSEFGRLAVAVCYDMQFPEIARAYAAKNVDLLLVPTWGWEARYASARAFENGMYVASSMAVPWDCDIDGHRRIPSQLIGPSGMVIAEGRKDAQQVVIAEFDPRDCAAQRSGRLAELEAWKCRR